jgi:hypothetical protein
MVSIHEAAERLKRERPEEAIPEAALRRMAKAGKVPALKVGTQKILIDFPALVRFLSCDKPKADSTEGKDHET